MRPPSPSAPECETALPDWALSLLRCPHCMSSFELGTARDAAPDRGISASGSAPGTPPGLQCPICGRIYPWTGGGPRLRREDDLAVLAQDIVTMSIDPDASLLSHRIRATLYERRNRFLARMTARNERGGDCSTALSAAVSERLERFIALLPPMGTVLDLGYGPASWTLRLAERGLHVLHVDHGSRNSTAAMDGMPAGTPAYIEASALEMPCANASFDGVWCHGLFSRIRADRRTVFFRQVHRVLRPGGLLFLSASTAGLHEMLGRHLLWRLMREQPILFGEQVTRTDAGWSFMAQLPMRSLYNLARQHGLRTTWLQADERDILMLARKV